VDRLLLQDRVTGFVRDLAFFQSKNPFDFVDLFRHSVDGTLFPTRFEVLLDVAVRERRVEVVRDPVLVVASLAHHDDIPLSVGLPRHNDTVLRLADIAGVLQREFGIDEGWHRISIIRVVLAIFVV